MAWIRKKAGIFSAVSTMAAAIVLAAACSAGVYAESEKSCDTVKFGEYPSAEVTDKSPEEYDSIPENVIEEGDVIYDAELYEKLENAEWTDDETVIDDKRYLRSKSDRQNEESHYHIDDSDEWHYFEFDDIEWRVLEDDGDSVLLLSDKILFSAAYNDKNEDVFWENCSLRDYLNTEFYDTAFSDEEKTFIIDSENESTDNHYFGTDCGEDTTDRVFILSESQVLFTDEAESYGFMKSDAEGDEFKYFLSTAYSKFTGTWWSENEDTLGNGFFATRTDGYTEANIVYMNEGGYGYNRGIVVTCSDIGIIPAVRVERDALYEDEDTGDKTASPVVTEDETAHSGQRTVWSTVYFGTYPAAEIVESEFDSVDDYALSDGDYIADADLYSSLTSADWENDITEIDSVRYLRLKGEDAVTAFSDREQHYRWADTEEYHYFRFEPIKWKVLSADDSGMLLISDRALDCAQYSADGSDCTWQDSSIRKFLNEEFYNTAFSDEEKQLILDTEVENAANSAYGTYCGENTTDRVFLLSYAEVNSGDMASLYGYHHGDGIDDAARRVKSTLYAKAKGTWWSPVEGYRGNAFWLLRTNGYSSGSVAYVCDFGYTYTRGTMVNCDDAGIVPMIKLSADADPEYAGTVCSEDMMQDSGQ